MSVLGLFGFFDAWRLFRHAECRILNPECFPVRCPPHPVPFRLGTLRPVLGVFNVRRPLALSRPRPLVLPDLRPLTSEPFPYLHSEPFTISCPLFPVGYVGNSLVPRPQRAGNLAAATRWGAVLLVRASELTLGHFAQVS